MNIWIMNHYASSMFKDKAGRHYWFAKKLKEKGYDVTVFCANTFLNNTNIIDTNNKKYKIIKEDGIPFVFVKTVPYRGNGIDRIKNMLLFFFNVIPSAKKYAKESGKPDIILASSVHPLTLVAGILLSKKMKIPCVCEIRDLWPEAIFSFGKVNENSFIGKILIKGEHWIYRSADSLIFTKEGDTDYLIERGWDTEHGGDIDLKKCHYINNGVDLKSYDVQIKSEILNDSDLINKEKFNVVYAGTIRPVNNVGNILDAAKIIESYGTYDDIQFLIYGEGNELENLKARTINEDINNVKIKGFVERKYIPYILSKSSVNILNYSQSKYNWSRGNSSNKLFEYMASGKPVISTVKMGYSIIKKYKCGIELDLDTPQDLADAIVKIHDLDKIQLENLGTNSRIVSKNFDFEILTDKLIDVIKNA